MYCVNCGVELHETAENCVLCGTFVINPNLISAEDLERYKSHKKANIIKLPNEETKPYGQKGTRQKPPNYVLASIFLTLLTTISITCHVINGLYSPLIPWSYIVSSSCILLAIIILYPMLSKETSGYIYTFGISFGTFLILHSVSRLTKSNAWLYEFSLPLLLLITFEGFLFISLRRKFTMGILPSTAIILIMITVMQLCCEALLNILIYGKANLEWSYIVAAACTSIAVFLFFVTLSRSLRTLFRRLFHW